MATTAPNEFEFRADIAEAQSAAAKARALMDGRFNLGFEDIKAVALPSLRHRIILNFEAEAEGISTDTVLQQILDRAPPDPGETYTLQALGVALGDVMAAQLGLEWVSYRDELGPSRALRLGQTDLVIFPVTMISKRVELSVPFRIEELYRKTAEEIARYRRERPGRRVYPE